MKDVLIVARGAISVFNVVSHAASNFKDVVNSVRRSTVVASAALFAA